MAVTFTNGDPKGTLTIDKQFTAAQATRLVDGVLGRNNIPTKNADGSNFNLAQKRAAFNEWLWKYLIADAKSWEAEQEALIAATTADTELNV
jgi:hypothetical protein